MVLWEILCLPIQDHPFARRIFDPAKLKKRKFFACYSKGIASEIRYSIFAIKLWAGQKNFSTMKADLWSLKNIRQSLPRGDCTAGISNLGAIKSEERASVETLSKHSPYREWVSILNEASEAKRVELTFQSNYRCGPENDFQSSPGEKSFVLNNQSPIWSKHNGLLRRSSDYFSFTSRCQIRFSPILYCWHRSLIFG